MDDNDKGLYWDEKNRKRICECLIFDYYQVRRKGPSGDEADFTLIDAPDWVTVIALLLVEGEEHVLMVRQFRHGSGTITVEFPAGVVESDENPIDAAKRELKEETGYEAKNWIALGAVNPNPAFMNNSNHTFLAQDLMKVDCLKLDEHEWLEPNILPLSQVIQELGKGEFNNGIMMSALALFWQHKKNHFFLNND